MFYQWYFLGIFPHKCICPWEANAARGRLVERLGCSKDRVGIALCFAAVSVLGVGGSVYIGVFRDLANLAVPRSSVAMASCGLRRAVCTVEKHGRDSQERVLIQFSFMPGQKGRGTLSSLLPYTRCGTPVVRHPCGKAPLGQCSIVVWELSWYCSGAPGYSGTTDW